TSDGKNYLVWLAERARTAFEDLRQERGFLNDTPPRALLYALLRHALLLGYWGAALDRRHGAGLLTDDEVARARREPATVPVAEGGASESRYAALYSRDDTAPGVGATVADAIQLDLSATALRSTLAEQVAALDVMKEVPTARLERCFAEH